MRFLQNKQCLDPGEPELLVGGLIFADVELRTA